MSGSIFQNLYYFILFQNLYYFIISLGIPKEGRHRKVGSKAKMHGGIKKYKVSFALVLQNLKIILRHSLVYHQKRKIGFIYMPTKSINLLKIKIHI